MALLPGALTERDGGMGWDGTRLLPATDRAYPDKLSIRTFNLRRLPTEPMSYFKFAAKDLAESGYDSSDSTRTAIARYSPPLTPTPTSFRRGQTSCRRRPGAATLLHPAHDHDHDHHAVQSILRSTVTVGARIMTVMEAATAAPTATAAVAVERTREGSGSPPRHSLSRPPFGLAVHMHNLLARSTLSVRQKAAVFARMGWYFECMSCGRVQCAANFDTTLYLWGGRAVDDRLDQTNGHGKKEGDETVAAAREGSDRGGGEGEDVPHVRLRGGPCRLCVAEARAMGRGTDILLISVNLPEACKMARR